MPKLKRNTNWRRNEPIDEPSSQKKDVLSVGKDIMPYPHVSVNCTVHLERLDPAMFTVQLQPQTKKIKGVPSREYWNRKSEEYRSNKKYLFNLLREWVPGTKDLSQPQLIKKTANYIQELLNPDFIPRKTVKVAYGNNEQFEYTKTAKLLSGCTKLTIPE